MRGSEKKERGKAILYRRLFTNVEKKRIKKKITILQPDVIQAKIIKEY